MFPECFILGKNRGKSLVMSGGSPIVGPWPAKEAAVDDVALAPEEHVLGAAQDAAPMVDYYDHDEPEARTGLRKGLIAALSLLTIGWVGLASYTQYMALGSRMPLLAEIANFVALICAPLALIGVMWLLIQRSSRLGTQRIGKSIDDIRAEEARLSLILDSLSARIDSGRLAIAEQADSLMSLGEDASHRLTKVGNALHSEVETIGRHATTLKTSAAAARADIAVLLSDLPKSLVQTRQMVAALQEAGTSAVENSTALGGQLEALSARGREAEQIAGGAAQKLAEHLTSMEGVSESASVRLEQAAADMTGAVDGALARAADALAAARQGMEAQGSAMLAMVEHGQAAMAKTGADAAQNISERVEFVAERVNAIARTFAEQDAASQALLTRMTSALDEVEQRFAVLGNDAPETADRISATILGLRTNADALVTSLGNGGKTAEVLIRQAETLLTALDASTREMDETLPAAQARVQQTLEATQAAATALAPQVDAMNAATETALERLREADGLIAAQRSGLDGIVNLTGAKLAESRAATESLSESIDAVDAKARAIAESTGPRLVEALVQIKETANQAADHTKAALDRLVPVSAEALAEKSREALHKAITEEVEERIASIAQAAEAATQAAQKATDRLMRQMITITETTATLEARVAEAREDVSRSDDSNFARRVALIVESLNSTAIDVTKILSNEVTDTAWAAYLRGDRGVFTRRAVKLLDGGEVREIAKHYEEEPEFREHVNRYIHDFESMLRHVLAARDGTPLSVTLLSSDAGKLYVALAQAIDRLRI
jgi:hypothetical protein